MATKRERAMENYNGHNGMATVSHVESNIEAVYPEAYNELTGKQYGKVMSVANRSYHNGKKDAGAWRDSGLVGFDGVCVPEGLLKAVRKVERRESVYRLTQRNGGTSNLTFYTRTDWYITDYYIGEQLIYTERV